MAQIDYIKKLKQAYRQKGIYSSENNNSLPLHRACLFNDVCWESENLMKRQDSETYNGINCPYIGQRYHDSRLLAIGENNRNDVKPHCFRSEQFWVQDAAKRIISREPKGTNLYSYLSEYVTIILVKLGILKDIKLDEIDNTIKSSVLNEYIAWTQLVKCNPQNENGNQRNRPRKNMYKICPKHILKDEIEILNPKYILTLGKETFNETITVLEKQLGYSGSSKNISDDNKVRIWKGKLNSFELVVIGTFHPSYPKYVFPEIKGYLKNITIT